MEYHYDNRDWDDKYDDFPSIRCSYCKTYNECNDEGKDKILTNQICIFFEDNEDSYEEDD